MAWRDWLKARRSGERPAPDAGAGEREPSGDFETRLEQAGLSQWRSALVALDRHSIRLKAEGLGGDIPVGATRLGGEPDLPPATVWPDWNGRPLAFIAQIAFAELPAVPDQRLPKTGLLSFFYEAEQGVWGFDPADRGAWRVLWSEEGAQLDRRSWPDELPSHARYRPRRLVGALERTHVPWESSEIDQLGMSRDESFEYAEVVDDDSTPIHRFLGHPEPVQGDMQLECQLVSHGLYCGDSSGYQDPRAEALRAGASEWRLLLQVDSDDDAEMMWGDGGRLYYWLRRDALERGAWDEAWMILQCS